MMRVISLGAGVQSTTMLLLANHGELPGGPVEAAVFADTGWEPKGTYEYLAWLERKSEIPVYRVSRGNLRQDALSPLGRFASIPAYLLDERGGEGVARRQCTSEYKLKAIRDKLRELLGVGPTDHIPPGTVESLIGISVDEVARMKPSREQWIVNRWPLVDKRMSRHDCQLWLARHGYPTPPKSACIGCPYHGNAYWRDMKRNRPEEWEDACSFDEAMRDPGTRFSDTLRGTPYLHRQRIPLRLVDLATAADGGQMDLFGDECEGMCGL